MAKTWGNQTYNEDWQPIDAMGNVLGEKDWQANREWDEQNAPGGAWNFSPEVKAANPVKWDQTPIGQQQLNERAPKPFVPTPTGTWSAANNGSDFSWDNPGDFSPAGGGVKPGFPGGGIGMVPGTGGQDSMPQSQGGSLSVSAPNLDNAALMSQLQGPTNLGQVQGPAALGQVQGPAALGAMQGPANLGQVQGPAGLSQLQGPANLGQVQGPAALQQLGATPNVAAAGPVSAMGQQVQGSIQRGLADPTVDTNSPVYQQQVAAFQRNAQRAAERNRASAAARMNAQGTLGSGSFDATVNRINQNQGAAEQDFEAQLMQSELNAGRERQARAQQLGAGLLSQEQQQSLSERLANQSSALQGMGMNNQRDLANQNTAMQALGLNSQRDMANQSGALQMAGLNSGRDLAGLQAQLQTQALNSGRDQSNQQAALAAMGFNNQRDLSNQSTAMQTLGLNSGRDQSNQQSALAALGLNNQRDLANQSSQLQTLGLNNQRDLTGYQAQNQRDLTRYGGQMQANLANQGAQMQQRGYNLQKYLGGRDLDLRGQQMNNQNQQFYDQLGQQLGLETGRMNQQALLALLGGG